MKKKLGIILLVALLMLAGTASAVTIKEGFVGVKSSFGKVHDELLTAGWHWTAPWDHVEKVDLHWQKYDLVTSAFSKDIQQVDVQMSFNYSLQRDGVLSVYRNIGMDYAEKIMLPLANDALKSTFAKYSAEGLVTNRDTIAEEVKEQIEKELDFYKIKVREVAITDIDFTDAFTNAIEAKQVATQNKLKTQTEQDQATIVAKGEAERALIATQSQAEQTRIKAESEAEAVKIAAEAEAYRLELEAKNITDKTIEKTLAERWDGKLPMVSGGAAPIMDMSDMIKTE